jgi:hypothetical protein
MSLLNMKSCRCAKLRLMSFRLDLVCVERLCRSWPFSAAKEPSHIKQSHSSIKRHHRVVPVRRYKIQSRSHRQHTLFTHPIRPFDQTTIAPTSTFTLANTYALPTIICRFLPTMSFPIQNPNPHASPNSNITPRNHHPRPDIPPLPRASAVPHPKPRVGLRTARSPSKQREHGEIDPRGCGGEREDLSSL